MLRIPRLLAPAAAIAAMFTFPAASQAACANPVACENALPGSPPSSWQVTGAGDSTIQGYATSMGVNKGDTIRFKVKTTASAYKIDVYRLGYTRATAPVSRPPASGRASRSRSRNPPA